jgi:hypothetical protein
MTSTQTRTILWEINDTKNETPGNPHGGEHEIDETAKKPLEKMPGFEDEIRLIGLYGHNRVVKGIIYDGLYMDWSD